MANASDRSVGSKNDEFSAFYQRENAAQVRRAAALLGSIEEANDVVHDAFLELFQRWHKIENPGGYLQRTVLTGCRDRQRRNGRLTRLFPKLVERSAAPADEILSDVLDGLPFNQRAAVVLRFFEGMTENEIAEALDCPPGSVGPWISRAMTAMKRAIQ